MNQKLQKAVQRQKQSTSQKQPQIYGMLGIRIGGTKKVEVPKRNGYVYVRLRNNQSEVIQAFNNQVAPAYNLPVIVERRGNRYSVFAVDTQRYENNWNSFAPFLPRHGNTHSFDIESGGGGDIVWVQSRQFMPALVFPSGSLGAPNVFVAPYTLKKEDGTWMYVGNTGTQNITTFNPSSPTGAVMGLIYLNANDGNPYVVINSGTIFSSSITGTNQLVQYIPQVTNPSVQIPLAAIRLVTGTSQISWDNIYDVRQWLHPVPTGTGGGIGNITVQDEGINKGTATVFNFVGDGVTASVSGSVAQINIVATGSASVAELDNRYLKLDTSNDPITGELRVSGSFDAGYGQLNREANAGKFGYEKFSPGYFDWVGAGTGTPRWHWFHDNTRTGLSQFTNLQSLTLRNEYAYLNATGTLVSPFNATTKSAPTGSDYLMGMDSQSGFSSMKSTLTAVAQGVYHTDAIGTFLDGTTVQATGTYQSCPWKPTANATANTVPWIEGGILSNLSFRRSTSQPASGSLVVTLFVNNVATALTLTVAAGSSGSGTTEDNTHEVPIVAGDLIRWAFQNNATSASCAMTSIAMKLRKPSIA